MVLLLPNGLHVPNANLTNYQKVVQCAETKLVVPCNMKSLYLS